MPTPCRAARRQRVFTELHPRRRGHLPRARAGSPSISSPPPRLLADGDRLALGPRLRLRYLRANPASQTAVLELTAGRFALPHLRRMCCSPAKCSSWARTAGATCATPSSRSAVTLRSRPGGLSIRRRALTPDPGANPPQGKAWSVSRFPIHPRF